MDRLDGVPADGDNGGGQDGQRDKSAPGRAEKLPDHPWILRRDQLRPQEDFRPAGHTKAPTYARNVRHPARPGPYAVH
ncbi:hypothetical protein GCM10010394_47990 [Streptomyces crystallinus]|uniref:Uncharacterized protein n=1 Tax=Streptomyces crystallinus TaxID=68191 RepID=A0ABP3RKV3_9ACTN